MVRVTVCAPIFFIICVKCQDLASLINIDSLSELPLESLLNVRKNILQLEGNETDIGDKKNGSLNDENIPEALPLLGIPKIRSKGGYYVQYGDEDKKYDKKKSISTIFQLSVTTLAFLAFGGYLLYLVIAAIKGKQYNYMYDPNTTQIMSAMINAQINNRKKRKRKPIRLSSNAGTFGYKQSNRYGSNGTKRIRKTHKHLKVKRDTGYFDANSEVLYDALTNLCEGYTKFYSLDYAHPNFTSCIYSNTCSTVN